MASSLCFRMRVVYTKESLYTGNKETKRLTTIEAHSQRDLQFSVFGLQADLRVDLQIDVYADWKSIPALPLALSGGLLHFDCCASSKVAPSPNLPFQALVVGATIHGFSEPPPSLVEHFLSMFPVVPLRDSLLLLLSVLPFTASTSVCTVFLSFTFVVEACLSQLSFLVITVSSLNGLSASLLHTSRLSRVWNVSVAIASSISPWLQPANLDCESKFPQRLSCSEQLLPQRDLIQNGTLFTYTISRQDWHQTYEAATCVALSSSSLTSWSRESFGQPVVKLSAIHFCSPTHKIGSVALHCTILWSFQTQDY